MTTKKEKDKPEPFEKSLERLEEIVRDLESGEKGLEESLGLFEEGVGLSKRLSSRLEEVRARVEVLTKEGKGRFSAKEVDPEDVGG
ncbi:MAG: exodeoxyribonuclease VII small subunit [Elusimicrobia bacterium]|nr:exodeoxyribonuclease VII small subunit [Elusimicrobiota bacterium]